MEKEEEEEEEKEEKNLFLFKPVFAKLIWPETPGFTYISQK